jgi:hypothetical protein
VSNGGGLLARSSHVGLELNLLAFVRMYRGREREGEKERETESCELTSGLYSGAR